VYKDRLSVLCLAPIIDVTTKDRTQEGDVSLQKYIEDLILSVWVPPV